MFSHEEECTVPRYSIWKMQNCCVLFLIIRCQGFKTEQFWKALLLQMLLVWDVKPCAAFLHPTWNKLEEADNENVAFLLFFPYYQSSEQPLAERQCIHWGWCIHARVCDIRVSSCMCKMLEVWIRQHNTDMHMKGCTHLCASMHTFLCASFICMHVYVWAPECSREELWRITLGLRKGGYDCLEEQIRMFRGKCPSEGQGSVCTWLKDRSAGWPVKPAFGIEAVQQG